jgi:hypothetical protein
MIFPIILHFNSIKKINYEGVDRIYLAKNRVQCRVLVKMVTNFQVPKMAEKW